MNGLKKNLVSEHTRDERMSMIDLNHPGIPVSVQADLLGINRTSLYYKPVPVNEADMHLNRKIDEIYTAHPFFGYRRITAWLHAHHDIRVDPKTVYARMRRMGIMAVYPRQNTSKANPLNKVYPYLLKGLAIERPDQVWSIDITYIPVRKSWLYLAAIIDWYSRYVLGWEISDTLEIGFVLEVCRNALAKSRPEIMNSDQGSHFTSSQYTRLFEDEKCKISMDHRGRAYDNIFIERLWRSLKYENVYLSDYSSPREARTGIREYLMFYNMERPHQSLRYKTPAAIYKDKKAAPSLRVETDGQG
jgi:putative transposase